MARDIRSIKNPLLRRSTFLVASLFILPALIILEMAMGAKNACGEWLEVSGKCWNGNQPSPWEANNMRHRDNP